VIPTAGTATWASTFPTATAVPGKRPIRSAKDIVNSPALAPMGAMSLESFSSTTFSSRGSNALKNSLEG